MDPRDELSTMTPTRRAVLGGTAGLVAGGTGGCVQRTRSLLDRGSTSHVSLEIKTVPADADRAATMIARQLGDNLRAVGVDADVVLESEDELLRNVLLSHDFDLYVARIPDHSDPDFLRPLLHSVFVEEPGWQNPFGFADLSVDELLVEQRSAEGSTRRTAVSDLLRAVARLQPFSVVVVPDEVRAVRRDRFRGWRSPGLASPLGYLALEPREANNDRASNLRVTITDQRVTRNFNPIAVEFRNRGTFTSLLYDPLARRVDGTFEPWLAEEWSWTEDDRDTIATVRLREDLSWHDGRSLTAQDVAFTYEFLEDTSLGQASVSAPAPRFRGPTSLVETVDTVDDRTVRFAFGDTGTDVALRALAVPILPEQEWRPQSTPANIAGLDLFEGVTEALVWNNPDPIGSGVLRFERSIPEDTIVLRRFDDHFLHRNDGPEGWVHGGVAFEQLTVSVTPSDAAAVELVAIDEADATATSVDSNVVPRIGRTDGVELVVNGSRSFYHVGFNVRRDPLSNPRFRRTIARLLDKQYVADAVVEGYATPAAVPLAGTEWTPSDLDWDGEDPSVPFFGSAGELDVGAARDAFREIGYQFDEDGNLLGR